MYNLVDEVLQKFGYPKEIALTARGECKIMLLAYIRLKKIAEFPNFSEGTAKPSLKRRTIVINFPFLWQNCRR